MAFQCLAMALLFAMLAGSAAAADRLSRSSDLTVKAFRDVCLESFETPLFLYSHTREFEDRKLRRQLIKHPDFVQSVSMGFMSFWTTNARDVILAELAGRKGQTMNGTCHMKAKVKDADALHTTMLAEALGHPAAYNSFYSGPNISGEAKRDVLCVEHEGNAQMLLLTVANEGIPDLKWSMLFDAFELPGTCADAVKDSVVAIPSQPQ